MKTSKCPLSFSSPAMGQANLAAHFLLRILTSSTQCIHQNRTGPEGPSGLSCPHTAGLPCGRQSPFSSSELSALCFFDSLRTALLLSYSDALPRLQSRANALVYKQKGYMFSKSSIIFHNT